MGNEITCNKCPIDSTCEFKTHCHINIENEANNGNTMTNPQLFLKCG